MRTVIARAFAQTVVICRSCARCGHHSRQALTARKWRSIHVHHAEASFLDRNELLRAAAFVHQDATLVRVHGMNVSHFGVCNWPQRRRAEYLLVECPGWTSASASYLSVLLRHRLRTMAGWLETDETTVYFVLMLANRLARRAVMCVVGAVIGYMRASSGD